MVIETLQKGDFILVRFLEDLNLSSDISTLQTIIERNIADRNTKIAFSFTENSFLYTHHIAVLIRCLEILKDANGMLSIVNPNEDIIEVLSLIDPEGMIKHFSSIDELN